MTIMRSCNNNIKKKKDNRNNRYIIYKEKCKIENISV